MSADFHNPLAAPGDHGMSRAQAAILASGGGVMFPGIASNEQPNTPIGMGPADIPSPEQTMVFYVEKGQAMSCSMAEYVARQKANKAKVQPARTVPQPPAQKADPAPAPQAPATPAWTPRPAFSEVETIEKFGEVEAEPRCTCEVLHEGHWVLVPTVENVSVGDDGSTMIVWLSKGTQAWSQTPPGAYYDLRVNGTARKWVLPGAKFTENGRTGMLLVAAPA